MLIALMADTHQNHKEIDLDEATEKWVNADVVIVAGDFSYDMWGVVEARGAFDFFNWFAGLPHKHKVLIAGNHDFIMEKMPSTRFVLPESINYLEGQSVTIEGLKFWGGPWTPRFFDWAFNVDRGEDIKRYWDSIPRDTDVLITHGPPHGILDETWGKHAGCEELWEAVKEIRPKLHVFGHIHEGRGQEFVEWDDGSETIFVNATVVNGGYEYTHRPWTVEVSC